MTFTLFIFSTFCYLHPPPTPNQIQLPASGVAPSSPGWDDANAASENVTRSFPLCVSPTLPGGRRAACFRSASSLLARADAPENAGEVHSFGVCLETRPGLHQQLEEVKMLEEVGEGKKPLSKGF